MDYPYIRIWNEIHAGLEPKLEAMLEKARKTNAPQTAVHEDESVYTLKKPGEVLWVTMKKREDRYGIYHHVKQQAEERFGLSFEELDGK